MPPLSSRSHSAESLLESDLLSRKLLMVRKKRGKKNDIEAVGCRDKSTGLAVKKNIFSSRNCQY